MNYFSYIDLKFNIKLLIILVKFFYKKRSIVKREYQEIIFKFNFSTR